MRRVAVTRVVARLRGSVRDFRLEGREIDKLLAAMNSGSNLSRCDAIRALCPCRNNSIRDLDVWAEIFRKAREGGFGNATRRRTPSER